MGSEMCIRDRKNRLDMLGKKSSSASAAASAAALAFFFYFLPPLMCHVSSKSRDDHAPGLTGRQRAVEGRVGARRFL